MADAVAAIPMAGFVESLNVSVAAALIMVGSAAGRGRGAGGHASRVV